MKNIVLTIGREYGSGGRYIGEMVSKKLNIPFYDRVLIEKAYEKIGGNYSKIDQYDEVVQNKFLKIGYSKRKDNATSTASGRPFIGRKGIGKLALLSCAKRITVLTKTANTDLVGGVIDNSGLDKAIKDDVSANEQFLAKRKKLFQWRNKR